MLHFFTVFAVLYLISPSLIVAGDTERPEETSFLKNKYTPHTDDPPLPPACPASNQTISTALEPYDEVDGWLLLTPLIIGKGVLAKGVKTIFQQRELIRKAGQKLKNLYGRYQSSDTDPSQEQSARSPLERPELSPQDIEALQRLNQAYTQFHNALAFASTWGTDEVPYDTAHQTLAAQHYAENIETFHKALQAFRDYDSPALRRLTQQTLCETLAFEHEVATMCQQNAHSAGHSKSARL